MTHTWTLIDPIPLLVFEILAAYVVLYRVAEIRGRRLFWSLFVFTLANWAYLSLVEWHLIWDPRG